MKPILIVTLVFVIIAVLLAGFFSADQQLIINRIETEHRIQIQAEYSKFDGEETDYWTEVVSPTWCKYTVTDRYGFHVIKLHGDNGKHAILCGEPPKIYDHDISSAFDRYSTVSDITIKVWFDLDDMHEDYVTISFDQYRAAVSLIDQEVTVSTWYGQRYGLKF